MTTLRSRRSFYGKYLRACEQTYERNLRKSLRRVFKPLQHKFYVHAKLGLIDTAEYVRFSVTRSQSKK